MFVVQQISSDALQSQTLVLSDGTQVQLQMRFVPLQYGWFISQLNYGDFALQGYRIVASPNMLHQYINQIPFGLACFVSGGRDPTQQQDFSSGAAQLYVLTHAECLEYAAFLSGGAFPP